MILSLAACSNDSDISDGSISNDKERDNVFDAAENGMTYDGTWGSRIADEPVEIKIFARQSNDVVIEPDAAFWSEFQKLTGVTVVNTANGNVDKVTDLNVHATDKFPSDIVTVAHDGDAMVRYAAEGAFLDLNNYMEYMPNLRAFIQTDLGKQAYEASLSENGEFFLIPAVERFKVTHIPMIRKDWLDQLGLEIPQTTEELHDALLAFKTNELGDGITIPFLAKDWVLKQNATVLFGARVETRATGRMVNDENGVFTNGWLSDDFRTAVTEYSKWYDEGLLAQDIFTIDNPLEKYFPTDQGGFTYWSISKLGFNDQPDMPEGFELVPMLPTEYNEEGERLDQRATHFLRKGRMGISAASENPEVAAMVMDYFLSLEGAMIQTYGLEGIQYEFDYETEDGIKIYRYTEEWEDIVEGEFNNDRAQANFENGFLNIGITHDAFYDQTRVIRSDEEFGESIVEKVEAMYDEAYSDGTVSFIPAKTVIFSPDEVVEINTIKGALETYQNEFFEKAIVVDASTLDDVWWNEYVETCNSLGAERLVELYNNGL